MERIGWGEFMAKWDRIFRIAVVLLLRATLAVSRIICVRLADKAPVESSGKRNLQQKSLMPIMTLH